MILAFMSAREVSPNVGAIGGLEPDIDCLGWRLFVGIGHDVCACYFSASKALRSRLLMRSLADFSWPQAAMISRPLGRRMGAGVTRLIDDVSKALDLRPLRNIDRGCSATG